MARRNLDKRKEFLNQLAALERDSVNYFDVEKEFFLIDSENLFQIRPRLYGYSIQASGIYENDNLTAEAAAGLDGRGCYVHVDVNGGEITIKQDLNGCWGIYLFRHGDYFALSNSFFRLLEHVKFRFPLTVNRDYCHYLFVNGLCSHAYSETAVNEIRLVERNAVLKIDIAEKNLQLEFIDYKEHSIPLDSEQGIATLDRWADFWSGVFRGVAQHTKFISADLSGGFDSRISFALLLHSGIDLGEVNIHSIKKNLHTYAKDYEIASEIAAHYGLTLNKPLPEQKFLYYSLFDVLNITLYHRQTFQKNPVLTLHKAVEKCYTVNGYSGETLRSYWYKPPQNFFRGELYALRHYSPALARELFRSMEKIIQSAFRAICGKYKITDLNSPWLPQYLYQETRNRHHFGKYSSGFFLENNIILFPALDPELRMLQLETPQCPDPNLLMTLIFTRYEPTLLNFPFDSNHSIAPETIAFAKNLNARFPQRLTTDKIAVGGGFQLLPRDAHVEQIIASGRNNQPVSRELLNDCLKAAFESSKTYGLFTTCFDSELYNYAATYYEENVFGGINHLHSVLGVARVLEEVEISKRNHLKYRDIVRFFEEDFCEIPDDAQKLRKLSPYVTAALQIVFSSSEANEFKILSVSDGNANVIALGGLPKFASGYVIFSRAGNLNITAETSADGRMQTSLFGVDIRNPKNPSARVPHRIYYTGMKINGNALFNDIVPAGYDNPCVCNVDVQAGAKISVQVEWLSHESDA